MVDLNGQGGFDLLGRSRDSIRTEAEMAKARASCEALDLDGLLVSPSISCLG